MHPILLDAAGHRRQPVTLPGYHADRPPRNKGRRYPADPPTVEEIIAVMRTAGAGAGGVRLRALIVLLWRAGLRIGEALALDRDDVELSEGRLTVRRDKNGKSREIALHPSTVIALAAYARVRDELCPHPKDPSFLISSAGGRLHRQTVGHEFERLRRWCGLDYDTLGRAARIHDLRHTFILRTLLNWYREDADVEAQLPLLATFLGHYAGDLVKRPGGIGRGDVFRRRAAGRRVFWRCRRG